MVVAISLFWGLVALCGGTASAEPVKANLCDDGDYLPYAVEIIPRALPGLPDYPSTSITYLLLDLDSDGYTNVEEYLNQTNPIKND